MISSKLIELCNHNQNPFLESFHHSQNVPICRQLLLPTPGSNSFWSLDVYRVLSFLEISCEHNHTGCICLLLASFTWQNNFSFIWFLTGSNSSILLLPSNIQLYGPTTFWFHSPVDWQLYFLQFLASMNNAVMNICIKVFT